MSLSTLWTDLFRINQNLHFSALHYYYISIRNNYEQKEVDVHQSSIRNNSYPVGQVYNFVWMVSKLDFEP